MVMEIAEAACWVGSVDSRGRWMKPAGILD